MACLISYFETDLGWMRAEANGKRDYMLGIIFHGCVRYVRFVSSNSHDPLQNAYKAFELGIVQGKTTRAIIDFCHPWLTSIIPSMDRAIVQLLHIAYQMRDVGGLQWCCSTSYAGFAC